jgi:maltooligosyltrehalose trehalohydrolase
MHRFEVWAPRAKRVTVVVDGERYPMKGEPRDWWAVDVERAGPGSRYGFLLDDDESPVPDPRSPWQPDGVHGLSTLIDHSSFRWTDQEWRPWTLGSSVLYEMHVGTFTPEGTLDAAIGKLDYLRGLGITHVELLPLAAAEGDRGWGYDGVALYAPLPAYGGPEAVKRFVDAAHGKGLAVLIDVVYNHFGPSGNYTGKFGGYITETHMTPWGGAVNFEDAGSAEVREFFIQNALMWLRDYHFDGLRVDAVHAFVDRSATHFLRQLEEEVRALSNHTGRHYVVIAESDLNNPRLVMAREAGGYGLDAQWSDDFHHALWVVLTGERSGYYEDFGAHEDAMANLAKALKEVFVYQGQYSQHRQRNHGRPVVGLPADRFLGYIQNHDQVGNRAQGERLSQVTDLGRAKIAAAMVLLGPFVPMLFAGEEFAASTPFQYFTDFQDRELGRLVSEGRRKEFAAFGWAPEDVPDPQAEETYQRSKLRWDEVGEGEHAEMLDWYRRLIALRHQESALTNAKLERLTVTFDEAQKWLWMSRGPIEVVFNAGKEYLRLPVVHRYEVLLVSAPGVACDTERLCLPEGSVAVLRDLEAPSSG